MKSLRESYQVFSKLFLEISEHSFSRKEQSKGIRDMPVNISSKIVSSNLREWGRTVHANSVAHLSRKYKVDKWSFISKFTANL